MLTTRKVKINLSFKRSLIGRHHPYAEDTAFYYGVNSIQNVILISDDVRKQFS